MPNNLPAHIVFYDGECGLCNSGVQFLLQYDTTNRIHFSKLQSKLGQEALKNNNLPLDFLSTFIYLRNGNYHTKSTAGLYALKDCKNWISIGFIFIVIPKFIRDFVYELIAKNRHRFFKQKTTCWLPTPELRKRFIE